MEDSREQTIKRLMDLPMGLSREDAERRVKDDDLWIADAELREGLEGEAAVEAWREAVGFASVFAEGFSLAMRAPAGPATMQLFWDALFRAEEALRRAEERAARSQEANCTV